MTGDLRHTALDCSLSMHWLDIPFLHLFLSFSLCLDGASFEKDKALPPWNMWRSFKNEGIRHPGVPCMWFGGDFWGGGEVGELLPCHGLFVCLCGFANAKAKVIMEVHPDSWIVAICTSQNWSSSFSQCQIDYCHILLACEIRVSAKTCHMQTLPFLWIALKNVKFFPLILWLSMPIDEGSQPFWEGEAGLGISEIGAFLHFHAFYSRKCLLHNEFQRAAISYLRSPEMEAHQANRHSNGMSGWWGTSGQVDKWAAAT